eukprot:scaffold310754_cov31-Tisochrysis_lutea.AAC.2
MEMGVRPSGWNHRPNQIHLAGCTSGPFVLDDCQQTRATPLSPLSHSTGVDRLMETGKLDGIRSGPVLWVDSADSQPCIGTAGSLT